MSLVVDRQQDSQSLAPSQTGRDSTHANGRSRCPWGARSTRHPPRAEGLLEGTHQDLAQPGSRTRSGRRPPAPSPRPGTDRKEWEKPIMDLVAQVNGRRRPSTRLSRTASGSTRPGLLASGRRARVGPCTPGAAPRGSAPSPAGLVGRWGPAALAPSLDGKPKFSWRPYHGERGSKLSVLPAAPRSQCVAGRSAGG